KGPDDPKISAQPPGRQKSGGQHWREFWPPGETRLVSLVRRSGGYSGLDRNGGLLPASRRRPSVSLFSSSCPRPHRSGPYFRYLHPLPAIAASPDSSTADPQGGTFSAHQRKCGRPPRRRGREGPASV